MQALRGIQVLLMYDDGNGTRRTSPLLTVAGDSASSTKCFPNFGNFHGQSNGNESAGSNGGMSRSVIIGLSVGGAVIFLVGGVMALYLLRERRRKRRAMETSPMYNAPRSANGPDTSSQGHDMVEEKRRPSLPLPPLPTPTTISYPEGYVRDPPYVSSVYSPTISDYPRTSIDWGSSTPRSTIRKSSATPLSGMDIETMLDMAGDNSDRDSRLPISPRSPPSAYLGNRQADDTSSTDRAQPADVPKNSSFFGSSPTYAEMHGFDRYGGTAPFFESPGTITSSVLRPSAAYNGRMSYASVDSQFLYVRPLHGSVPISALSDAYTVDTRGSGRRNSIPFPIAVGSDRDSRDASDRV
ncbi:hypothetical protein PQX77_000516 [Marasmius sp. AFHP31]|nr:hypothetical protein PQX77_000516 [Marasmius sp. AFHP31]